MKEMTNIWKIFRGVVWMFLIQTTSNGQDMSHFLKGVEQVFTF